MKLSESELAAHVVTWLVGHTVYQEVAFAGRVADIVVDVDGRGWVIECKTSLGLSVLEQADEWARIGVTRISVAVPNPVSGWSQRMFAVKVANWIGAGVLAVGQGGSVREYAAPRFRRGQKKRTFASKCGDILQACNEQHRNEDYAAAGSARGGHWTPFKATCRQFCAVVASNPGISMKDAVDQIDSGHYASSKTARASLRKWIDAGVIEGIRVERNGKSLALFFDSDKVKG